MNGLKSLVLKNVRVLLNVRRLAREQSRFKILFIAAFSVALLVGLWVLFLRGFEFLDTLGGVGLMVVHRLFALFFFGMAILLVLSSILTAYAGLYQSREVPFLLLRPLPHGELILYKYLETALLSSWAFFFMIIPFVGAYAWHEGMPILFSAWTVLYAVPLVMLCSGLGMLITLMVVRWWPRDRRIYGLVILLLATLGGLLWRLDRQVVDAPEEASLILTRLIPGLRLSMLPLWPSWWVSEGIMAVSRGQFFRGFMLWAVLVSNLLLLILVVERAGRALFFEGWRRMSAAFSSAQPREMPLRFVEKMLLPVPADLRVIMLKDIRTFLRDPVQWSQFLIFFGILAVYFLNIRNLNYHTLPEYWRNLIAFLNVFSVSAVMSSFGSRFIYPQLSLEGQGFWILGLSPVSMGRVLTAKFLLALFCILGISAGLMFISVRMLDVQPLTMVSALGIAVAMSFAVSGLSTGLGAVFMDLKQQNPVAIISGFGGTLNLVLNLSFMMLAIFPFAALIHYHQLHRLADAHFRSGLVGAWIWLAVIAVCATAVPLWLGRRSLQRREY